MNNFLGRTSWCLLCLLGLTFRSQAQSTAVPMGNQPMEPTSWSFECAIGPTCAGYDSWISTTSKPGTVRLWNAGTEWDLVETSAGVYDWTYFDIWLDQIAAHQPLAVLYTFGHVPCWISTNSCTGSGWAHWSPSPPSDLTTSGSPAFKAFVTAVVKHCSPAGNCVKDYIKYWEMWNEANSPVSWTGTVTQVYDMFKPVIPIIRNNVPNAIVSTPPVDGDIPWVNSWMALENTKGRLSDYFGLHLYLMNLTPEERIANIEQMVSTKNKNGWTNTPWMNTETNFGNDTSQYTCSSQYSAEDCRTQLVRWHILQYAYQGGAGGAFMVGWYHWESISNGGDDTFYYTMMKWLEGATFTSSCANDGNVWTCPLTEGSGAKALIVWNAAGDSNYAPATNYIDYRKFNGTYGGATENITAGQTTTIGLSPIMFETAK